MDALEPESRRQRLEPEQGLALAKALDLASRSSAKGGVSKDAGQEGAGEEGAHPEEDRRLLDFLLPMAELGLTPVQMLGLLNKVPADWPLSHREIYYDFRLARWQKHIEPPTLAECLDEYLENAPSKVEGMTYIRAVWEEFLKRQGS